MRRIRNRRGAVAVEFGLIAPILFLLVFAIIDFGRAYYTVHDLAAAAREGARFAAPLADPVASEAEIRDVVKFFAINFGGQTVTDAQIEIVFDGQQVTVRIRDYPFEFLALPFATINVTKEATMRWERVL
ncbi:MAG: pilus assembly protein [Gemmatimonadota bacterium]|nr:MAG: pilus assembly protein [Gemmatimonadota bacterium]